MRIRLLGTRDRRQRALARVGLHRLLPVSLLMGTLADRHGLGVPRSDRDVDLLVEEDHRVVACVWLVPAGGL